MVEVEKKKSGHTAGLLKEERQTGEASQKTSVPFPSLT
jgi:hypothetical protein